MGQRVNSTNSLYGDFLDSDSLPKYSLITPKIIEEGIMALLQTLENEILAVEVRGKADWESGMEPVAFALTKLQTVWGKVTHLYGVKNSPELREVYAKVQPLVIQFGLRVSQSKILFKLFDEVHKGSSFSELDEPRRRFINSWLLAAHQAGVDLAAESLKSFNINQERLAQLAVDFSNHVLDDIKIRGVSVVSEEDLIGSPAQVIERCAQRMWFVSVDPTVSRPVLQHCHNQNLRRQLYRECIQVAADGKNGNATLLEEIVGLKNEQAELLGYSSTAAMCLESRMAKIPSVAIDFLENLLKEARPVAMGQFRQICEFARSRGADDVELADIPYWSERLREEKLGFSTEELRPYFPLDTVLGGLVKLINIIFGVTIRQAENKPDVWHPDVKYFLVENKEGEQIASFYFDPFVRPENKRGGAWMGICRYCYKLYNGVQSLPIAYIICNQTPSNSEGYSLMTFEEVTTLFHEFGHALHHMLAPPSWIGTSPIELSEWDAIEIESQFMEGWCYEPEVLRMISGHYKTEKSLPEHFIEGLQKERSFLRGHHVVRQLHLALTDLYLFSSKDTKSTDAQKIYHDVGARTREIPPLPQDSMLCAFSHIFSGGYTAGYYSYLWSQVLSADLFSAFAGPEKEQEWCDRVRRIGVDFSEKFFTRAGAVDPLVAFREFMGREVQNGAFLVDNGIG